MVEDVSVNASEEWHPVAGFQRHYEVSSIGRVRSVKFGRQRVLKPNKSRHGYIRVTLCLDGMRCCRFVHRLVAAAFIGPRPLGYQINHRDTNKENNHFRNLEYLTRLKNMRHAIDHQLYPRGAKSSKAKLDDDAVVKIRRLARTMSNVALGKMFGVDHRTIWYVVKRLTWTHIP